MNDEVNIHRVVVTDIHMPFWSMVIFMVKWALASIPAIIILTLIASLAWRVITRLGTETVVVIELPSLAPTSVEPSIPSGVKSRNLIPRRNESYRKTNEFDVSCGGKRFG